jgi:hypothetical protein
MRGCRAASRLRAGPGAVRCTAPSDRKRQVVAVPAATFAQPPGPLGPYRRTIWPVSCQAHAERSISMRNAEMRPSCGRHCTPVTPQDDQSPADAQRGTFVAEQQQCDLVGG